jgi:hypothetical protein
MLKIGTGLSFTGDGRNRFNFVVDARKLMVPTPDGKTKYNERPLLNGVFGSFSDAPDGFSEEIQESRNFALVLNTGTTIFLR